MKERCRKKIEEEEDEYEDEDTDEEEDTDGQLETTDDEEAGFSGSDLE